MIVHNVHYSISTIFAITAICLFSTIGRAHDRSTPAVVPNASPTPGRTISQVYNAHREELGRRVGSVKVIRGYASYQFYSEGIIISHPMGAFELHGVIYKKFLALGAVRPPFPVGSEDEEKFLTERVKLIGFPMTDTIPFSTRGFYSFFERATIYYLLSEATDSSDPTSGAFLLSGRFYDKWNSLHGGLGPPLTDAKPIPNCGKEKGTGSACGFYQHFVQGVLYDRPGSEVVAIMGPMYRYWSKGMRGQDNDPDFRPTELWNPNNTSWTTDNILENPNLGFPIANESHSADGTYVQEFQAGTIRRKPSVLRGLRFFLQNAALLPREYKGTEKELAIAALIQHLRTTPYDIVGLAEVWNVKLISFDQQRRFIRELSDIYPWHIGGPDETDAEGNGGLLLLSRHRIIEPHQTIFRQCAGTTSVIITIPWADCLVNKGVLHARIAVPSFPNVEYDVFLTHTQNPDEDGTEAARAVVSQQFSHMYSFIKANSSPDRPAILMGDLNTDGINLIPRPALAGRTVYNDMLNRLGFPDDVWLKGGGSPPGVTFGDPYNSFARSSRSRSITDSNRYRTGQRLDYFLSWPGVRFIPQFSHSRVVVLQSSIQPDGRGRDISDHYGISTELVDLDAFTVEVRRPITRVSVELVGFRCLQVTKGAADATRKSNDDESYFSLRLIPAIGAATDVVRMRPVLGINNGFSNRFHGVSRDVADPGDYIDIIVSGWEEDTIGGNELGTQSLRLLRSDLLKIAGESMTRTLPIFTGDDSEYAVTIRVTVN